ncbi:HIRAN domain-containing protein [Auritidibacter ignavus]|uniref:HIRAN domain-containing protein n=1 Tax=Auritidibacter ignavus TaxID=678932 RepID=UPI002FE58898
MVDSSGLEPFPAMLWRDFNSVEVVGTYYHTKNIASILGFPPRSKYIHETLPFLLVPEPDNPHDPMAISVRNQGKLLGYLSREDARKYAPELHRLAASGYALEIRGDIRRQSSYSNTWYPDTNIRFRLPDPGTLFPLNLSTPRDLCVIPHGRVAQVLKEEDHFDHLFDYVPPSGEGSLILTLHEYQRTLKNGQHRPYVEVRLDGERVGELSHQTSQQFLDAVRHARDMDRTLGAYGLIKGSALAAELTIHAQRSSELSDDWVKTMPTYPRLVPESDTYDVPPAYQNEPPQPARDYTKKNPQKYTSASTPDLPSSLYTRKEFPKSSFTPDAPETIIDFPDRTDDERTAWLRSPQGELIRVAIKGLTGKPENETEYTVNGKTIFITDKDRQHTPAEHRSGVTTAMTVSIIVGIIIFLLIPIIGWIVGPLIIASGVKNRTRNTLQAYALEAEEQRGVNLGDD